MDYTGISKETGICEKRKIINGVTFYYDDDDDFELTDKMMDYLKNFALSADADDDAYSVYMDDGKLVIY